MELLALLLWLATKRPLGLEVRPIRTAELRLRWRTSDLVMGAAFVQPIDRRASSHGIILSDCSLHPRTGRLVHWSTNSHNQIRAGGPGARLRPRDREGHPLKSDTHGSRSTGGRNAALFDRTAARGSRLGDVVHGDHGHAEGGRRGRKRSIDSRPTALRENSRDFGNRWNARVCVQDGLLQPDLFLVWPLGKRRRNTTERTPLHASAV